MQPASKANRKNAIVMGSSMAGLLAARVLSDHYQKVTLIDRDVLPQRAQQRPGVPQGRHTHGILASGSEVLEKLFPGISKALIDAGAISGDIVRDCRWFFEGGCLSRFASGLNGLLLTRPMLEAAVRDRVLAIRNIEVRENTVVEALELNNGRVQGVRAGGEMLEADLTIDATGRGSRTPEWLDRAGYEKPRQEAVKIDIGYTTRFFRRKPSDLGGDLAAIVPPTPEGKRGGVLLAQEGDRWTLTLIGYFGNYAPEELGGFVEFSRTLPAPFIYQLIREAEPLGEAASYRFPASVRRRYETLDRFPAGYLVMGDAMSSFNPIYGQGMSVAALEAMELQKTLSEDTGDLAKAYFRRASKVVDTPWGIAAGNDLRMPEAVGPRTAGVRFINWYMSKLHRAAHSDPVLSLTFHRVGNLLAPPPTVMQPHIALRVLWRNLTAAKGAAAPEVARAAAGSR